jgi:N-acetyl-gamma-glutamyl-phosphate reductase
MKTKIAVIGATGYTALELLKLLARHPDAEVIIVTLQRLVQTWILHLAVYHTLPLQGQYVG